MAKIEIKIGEKTYPCRQTMGAMIRFKRETGKDVSEIENGVADMVTFLWCCIVSACRADGVEFDLPLLDFADRITSNDMTAWAASLNGKTEGGESGGEKKTIG